MTLEGDSRTSCGSRPLSKYCDGEFGFVHSLLAGLLRCHISFAELIECYFFHFVCNVHILEYLGIYSVWKQLSCPSEATGKEPLCDAHDLPIAD